MMANNKPLPGVESVGLSFLERDRRHGLSVEVAGVRGALHLVGVVPQVPKLKTTDRKTRTACKL